MNTEASPLFDAENFKALYQRFDSKTLINLQDLYSAAIVFKDPLHQLQGINSLKRYFASFLTTDMDCRFVFVNQLVNAEQAFFQWQMHYSHPRLQAGKTLLLNGGTLIKFHTTIYYHEDFYDLGAMVYQHIPILGWAVNKVNKHLVNH
jgi:hypothetical protein